MPIPKSLKNFFIRLQFIYISVQRIVQKRETNCSRQSMRKIAAELVRSTDLIAVTRFTQKYPFYRRLSSTNLPLRKCYISQRTELLSLMLTQFETIPSNVLAHHVSNLARRIQCQRCYNTFRSSTRSLVLL